VRLDRNIVGRMETFGRYCIDPIRSGIDAASVWEEIIAPLAGTAMHNSDAFATTLADILIPAGEWATYGGSRMLTELLGGDFQHPAGDALKTVALDFLRSRGCPNSILTGYEWQFWLDHKGRTEPWLVGRPRPTLAEGPITPLRPGELRQIAQVFPEPDSNLVFVRTGGDQGYVAVIDARWSDEDPRRVRSEWKTGATIDDLYWTIGTSFQVPTHWFDPELRPYFPLSRPRLD
jgi:hypothetical protein